MSGPSGVGKGTLIRRLEERRPELARSVSCTTRGPREGEVHGRDYRFVSPDEFRRMVGEGGFLEWAHVHGELCYGTPRAPVEAAMAQGRDIILEIDYQGARAVRQQLPRQAVLVFAAVARRLKTALAEIAHLDQFQYVVVNRQIEAATDQLEAILVGERQRLPRLDWQAFQAQLLREASEA